jgi:hypothetical protein
MKVRPFYNCAWLPEGVDGMTIYPFIFIRPAKKDTPEILMSHEMIHVNQVRRAGWIKFYASYVWYWAKGLSNGNTRDQAYLNIPWEREAYIWQVYRLTDAAKEELKWQ